MKTWRAWRAASMFLFVNGGLVALSCGGDDGGSGAVGSGATGSGAVGSGGSPNGVPAQAGEWSLDLAGMPGRDNDPQGGAASAAPCGAYQMWCGGVCVPTSADPKNCGGCGKTCMANEVCSGGVCSGECIAGLSACEGACVDLENDSANCGECGSVCEPGKGCANGRCAKSIEVGANPKKCVGGGPAIGVGEGPLECLGTLAQTTFRWSLCSCTDLNVSARFETDAYDSTQGPYKPGQLGGGVGVDRDVTNWSEAVRVGGTLWVAGTETYSSSGPPSEVKADMHLGGSWKASTAFTVDGPAYVVGSLSGVTVAGKTNSVQSVPAACDCAEDKKVPVAAIVSAHESNNDNDAIGLDPTALESPNSALRLDLPCGNFYLTGIKTSLATTVHVHGRTAIYVRGDVAASSALAFTLDPDAELDVFVAGTLKVSDTFVFGSPNYPALSRLYVGGTAKIALSDNVRLAGQFYAANSEQVVWSAKNAIYGAVVAGNFRSSDVTAIHYDRGVLRAGDGCGGDGAGGAGGVECGSCKDCHNQACIKGVCGACGGDEDCCSPLICREGSCVPLTVVK